MRSFPLPTGGSTRSRPGLRLRYFRVGGSLPMRDHAFLAGTVMNRLRLYAALTGDAACRGEALQAVHRRPHHVVRIGRAQALGQDVADPGAFEYRAHRATRDHTRSRRRRLEQHAARPVLADDLVGDRATRERDFVHAAARGLDGLPHRFADLVGLAGRDADLSLAVADSDQRVEAEAAPALHDLRDAIDRDDVLDHAVALARPAAIAFAPVATPASAPATTAPPAPPAPLAARAAGRPTLLRRRRGRVRCGRNVGCRNVPGR